MIALAALSLATAATTRAIPVSFDLASYSALHQQAQQKARRRRYRPVTPDLPADEASTFSLRWKLNKVKLKMALDLPY
jgi:hypothetical protein